MCGGPGDAKRHLVTVTVGFGFAVAGTVESFRPGQQLAGENAAAFGSSELP
jgi:hypothetical protein